MNNLQHVLTSILLVFVLSATAACDKDTTPDSEPTAEVPAEEVEEEAPEEAEEAPSDEGAADEAAALPEDVAAPAKEALAAYEDVRAKLVDDETEGLTDATGKIAESATKAHEAADDTLKPQFAALVKSAEGLHSTAGGDDVAAIRKAFGDVSKDVITLLSGAPTLSEGRHAFECPMAKGYKKWVQVDEELANPYMGQSMPACGGKAEMTP